MEHENLREPRIVALLCTYCTYTAADMAGSMRLQYPNPTSGWSSCLCTGKVDVLYLLEIFRAGADVVMVSGCEVGDCHFLEGNLRAQRTGGAHQGTVWTRWAWSRRPPGDVPHWSV